MTLSCQKSCQKRPLLNLWTGSLIYSLLPRLLQGKWAPFIGLSVSLLLNPSCICTNLSFGHVWSSVPIFGGGTPRSHGLGLLDRVQKRVVSIVASGLSSDLQALSHRRDAASLSLFYKYYHGKCSSALADLVPPRRVTVRSTRFSEQMHRHTVNSPMCRTKFYQSSFFPRTSALWNSLTNECFPPDFDLTAFKGRVNKFLLLK